MTSGGLCDIIIRQNYLFGGNIMNNAVSRRDQVDSFKKIFLIIKIVLMVIVSIVATVYLLYLQYSAPYIKNDRMSEISMEGFMKYFENPEIMLQSVSYGICSVIASCFIVFLIMHGIQTLVVRFMMRNSG